MKAYSERIYFDLKLSNQILACNQSFPISSKHLRNFNQNSSILKQMILPFKMKSLMQYFFAKVIKLKIAIEENFILQKTTIRYNKRNPQQFVDIMYTILPKLYVFI